MLPPGSNRRTICHTISWASRFDCSATCGKPVVNSNQRCSSTQRTTRRTATWRKSTSKKVISLALNTTSKPPCVSTQTTFSQDRGSSELPALQTNASNFVSQRARLFETEQEQTEITEN